MIFVRVRERKKNLQMISVVAEEVAAALTNFLTGLKLVSKVNYYGT